MFYSAPIEPDWVYGAETATPVAALLLFGDDSSGNNVAFDPTRDWRVVLIRPDSQEGRSEGKDVLILREKAPLQENASGCMAHTQALTIGRTVGPSHRCPLDVIESPS